MISSSRAGSAPPARHLGARRAGPSSTLAGVLALGAGLIVAGDVRAQTPPTACVRELTAEVVALDQAVQFNRYGSHHPGYMIYALRGDVVARNGGSSLTPGGVKLRDDLRPRPLVLRANVGDCLTIRFRNLLNPTPLSVPGVSVDQPATRAAGLHADGLNYVAGVGDDAANVGANASSLVLPGGETTYKLHATREGVFGFYNPAVQNGGESNIGSLAFGMFGGIAVQPRGAEWYRSQVSRAELDLATRRDPANPAVLKTLETGHPDIDYAAVYPANHPLAGRPVLAMLQGTKIVHGDSNALITGPNRGPFEPGTFRPNPVLEPNGSVEQGEGAGTRDRRDPYREFVLQFHDEVKAIQAFSQFEDETLGHTLHSVRDGFAINYGITGAGAQILANRFGVGPAATCAECKYEEFFLASWAGGDPALLVDVPANAQLDSNDKRDLDVAPSTRALYPADPSNVFPSYLGDRVVMRNLHFGKEAHIFHLHAHQWLFNPDQPAGSSYLDSQMIAPGSGYTYEIAYNGSGNRNQTVGDSIFHCHLYPHFAQGMWGLWRVHDVFERGTELDANGVAIPSARALPDGEIMAGTAIPAVVPLPTMALAPLPAPLHIANGQVVFDAPGTAAENNPGFPFFIAGQAGRRPPRPPMDVIDDGGLRRHVVVGGEAVSQMTRHDLDKVSESLEIRWLDENGEPQERAAMAFHARRVHPSVTPEGRIRAFVTNGRPPVRGAPYADPCMLDNGAAAPGAASPRVYKGAAHQMRLVMNRAGWHYPQARMLSLWEDVQATYNGTRAPEPLVMRATSNECIEFHHTNLVPSVSDLDDYQVRTPTDIIGQHIHLVKFDVTSSDGSGNGWNYEDGTMAPAEVRERIHAIRRHYDCSEGQGDSTTGNCPVARPHPFFGAGPNNAWLGAQTTVQRWFADPVVNAAGKDNTLRTVFTHDHFGPSSHQQNGLYAALVIAPSGTSWTHPETGAALNARGGRADGGPTSWMANVRTPNAADSYREFVLQISDYVSAYESGGGMDSNGRSIPDPARAINPPHRDRLGLPYLIGRPRVCPGGAAPPCPEAVSAADPGVFAVNYRNEPLALRLYDPNARRADGSGSGAQAAGLAGDPAYAFRSDIPRAMPQFNSQPSRSSSNYTHPALTAGVEPGDPWTPMLRAYRRDRVQVRMMAGAHEEMHQIHFGGLRWLWNSMDPNSGWRSSSVQAISEHFEMEIPLVAPEGDIGPHTDHIYSASASAGGYWHGTWGLVRAYEYQRPDLRPLPNNTPPSSPTNRTLSDGTVVQLGTTATARNLPNFRGVCPVAAPVRRYAVSAVAANVAIGAQGLVYNDRQGNYSGQRGPLTDPTAAIYVLDSDLSNGKIIAGRPVEPLVMRAAAGDCVEVTLTNRLPANWADQVVATANHGFFGLPGNVERFNANQLKPSMRVGFSPQLLASDVTRGEGIHVGLNRAPANAARQLTVGPGETTTYRWYAGLLTMSATNDLIATPVEFGALNLMPADRLRHSNKGLIAGMVVLPQGSSWTTDASTRMAATVTMPGGRTFRDFVVMFQNDVNLRAGGRPVCPSGAMEGIETATPQSVATVGCKGAEDWEDAGNTAINYRTEPMWFRLGFPPGENMDLLRRVNYANALSNSQVGGDPRTPVFTARKGQEVRFRLLQNGGHPRAGIFTLHGHNWSTLPYANGTVPSQRIEGVRTQAGYVPSPASGTRDAMGPAQHHNIVVEKAGGPAGVTGDYLFRNQAPDAFDQGAWGIMRVTP